jgi:acyl carrier protein
MRVAAQELEATIREHLITLFEVEPEKINRDARLFEDLDLDSIDAVDLVVQLQELTGRRFKPEEFKGVRTVGDITDRVQSILDN